MVIDGIATRSKTAKARQVDDISPDNQPPSSSSQALGTHAFSARTRGDHETISDPNNRTNFSLCIPSFPLDSTPNIFMCLGRIILGTCLIAVVGITREFDDRVPVLHHVPKTFHEAEGLLRHENKRNHHHKLMTMAEITDPLQSRRISAIADQALLIDEVNYLRSFAIEECRELVCSARGKERFAQCADSILSTDKKCRVGCQDHFKMWVLHRCYLAETFDCGGNIGTHSVDSSLQIFNPEGPQTLSEFSTSITNLFTAKGIDCQCCDFADVVVTKDAASTNFSVWTGLLMIALGIVLL